MKPFITTLPIVMLLAAGPAAAQEPGAVRICLAPASAQMAAGYIEFSSPYGRPPARYAYTLEGDTLRLQREDGVSSRFAMVAAPGHP